MPEHAMSTAKDIVVPPGLVICITGLPYSFVRVDGMPSEFMRAYETCELTMDSVEPNP